MKRLIYFTAAWCGPCRQFGPMLLAAARDRDLDVVKVDIDHDADGLAVKYGVLGVPTVVAEKDGEIVARFQNVNRPQLNSNLDAVAAA